MLGARRSSEASQQQTRIHHLNHRPEEALKLCDMDQDVEMCVCRGVKGRANKRTDTYLGHTQTVQRDPPPLLNI